MCKVTIFFVPLQAVLITFSETKMDKFENAQQTLKDDLKNHDIFIYNGKKTPYK